MAQPTNERHNQQTNGATQKQMAQLTNKQRNQQMNAATNKGTAQPTNKRRNQQMNSATDKQTVQPTNEECKILVDPLQKNIPYLYHKDTICTEKHKRIENRPMIIILITKMQ